MGGNVFQNTKPISKEDIKPTLKEFLKELIRIFPGVRQYLEKVAILGSAGKKEQSGDLDLGLDRVAIKHVEDWGIDQEVVNNLYKRFKSKARTATDKQLRKRAVLTAIAEKAEKESNSLAVDVKNVGAGTIFFQFPQYKSEGERDGDKVVQIDVNVGDLDWLKFSYYSDSYRQKNVKGLHRTQLIVSLLSNKGYIFYHNVGVKNKETGEIEITKPEDVVGLLSRLYDCIFTLDILKNYWKLTEFIEKHLDEDELLKVYKIYLGILDHTKCDIPDGKIMNVFLDHQEEWGLTGKFLPPDSKLYAFRDVM